MEKKINEEELDYLEPIKKSEVFKRQWITRSKNKIYLDWYIPVKVFSPYAKKKYQIRYIDKNDVIRLLAVK